MLHETIESLNALQELVERHWTTASKIILLFMASIDPETGKSWCPDCRDIDPILTQTLESWAKEHRKDEPLVWITCYVGQKSEWRNSKSPFRGEPYFLKAVPTLMVQGKEGRLEEGQLLSPEGIKAFLEGY
jgi:thiol-disulfide isomerase/thioredoxin